jgi:uncharacterized protein (DUF1501 family)
MSRLPAAAIRLRDGPSRRDLLRAGVLGGLGLALPDLLRLQGAAAGTAPSPTADACILLFLWGAPSQYETFDPKPDAPDGIRGEFGVTQTHTPGVQFGEHIPCLAQRSRRFAVARTCAQTSTHHQSAAYEALTGYPPSRDAVNLTATPADHPNIGSVVARLAPRRSALPPFVQLPQLATDVGNLTPGQFAGFFGRQFDPLAVVHDPSGPDFDIADLTLRPDMAPARLDHRQALLRLVDRQALALEHSAAARALDVYQDRAVRLLTNPAVRQAFDLEREPAALRDRYGDGALGQSCLLGRRLVEAGVKLVTVCAGFGGKTPQDAWDTHEDNFRKLRDRLLPPLDRALSALLDDLHERGLAERTLLLVMGEFGRTPRINARAGRDHWERCYSVMLAGGGIQPGLVHGRSDRIGAYPTQGRIFTPADITATVYWCLGIDPHAEVIDPTGRPVRLTQGEPMTELL